MNKIILGTFISGLVSFSLQAQTTQTIERGETVVLDSPQGYQYYQWQVSSDLRNFFNVPQGNVQHLSVKVNAPVFYRIKATTKEQRVCYLDTIRLSLQPVSYNEAVSTTGGGHGFVESTDGEPNARGINIPEDRVDGMAGATKTLTAWTNEKAMAVYYLHHPADIVDTEMLLKIRSGARVTFRIKVFDPMNPNQPLAESLIALRGTGAEQKVPIMNCAFPHDGYFRYQIECLEGCTSILEISRFLHHSPSANPIYKSNFRSSPSVHLGSWKSTDPKAPSPTQYPYDWCYQEVMIPKTSDILGTYAMSLGVLSGYMGIQVNGYDAEGPLHGVLFSMWDDGSTDVDPNLPDYRRAKALDHGKDVTVKRFGHEGTGVQTFKHGHYWKCGTYVQFITNCRPETAVYYVDVNGKPQRRRQKNTLVSAWYNAGDGLGWQYMATLRIPNKSQQFSSWYSFLENYNAATGQVERKAFYRNGYARARYSRTWFHCNSVKFGHTDGTSKQGSRHDFAQGVSNEEEGAFFMSTGGFAAPQSTENVMPLNTQHTAVDTINLKALEARVDQAIDYEKSRLEQEEMFDQNKIKKDQWELIDFSSEETKGERDNGRAFQSIDDDPDTYWHSQWKGGAAQYPHHLTVDMKGTYEVNGMEITMSGGTKRYIKAFNLYVSTDNRHWKKVYSEEEAPNKAKFRFMLEQTAQARYFKLEITDGYATDGAHIRINEMDLSGKPVQTGINGVATEEDAVKVALLKEELALTFNRHLQDVKVQLHAVNGSPVFTEHLEHTAAGETIYLPMQSLPKGVYLVSCQFGEKKIVKSVLWK